MSEWYGEMAGDNSERAEALGKFESADAFFTAHDELATNLDTLQNKNWRDDFAGDDDKFKSTLERYSTPADLGSAFREQKATISGGQYDKPPGEGATDDDIKAYREANNLPMEAAGYLDDLPDGLIVGEDDKVIMTDFMGTLHGLNVSREVGHEIIKWYNGFAESQQDAIAELDSEHEAESIDVLRDQWGSDYRANMNLSGAFIKGSFSEEAQDILKDARGKDGRAVMFSPSVVEGFAATQRRIDPTTELIPAGTGDAQQTLKTEIAGLNELMRDRSGEYWKGPKAQGNQDRLRQLLQIQIDQEKKVA